MQRPGDATPIPWTLDVPDQVCLSRPAARRCSCRCRRAGARTGSNTTTSCAGSTCSTATGWSSRSAGPARWTGTSPTARGAATGVWTTWLPVAETPQTAAREIDGALLDMTALAEASEATCESGCARSSAGTAHGSTPRPRRPRPCRSTFGKTPRRRSGRPGRSASSWPTGWTSCCPTTEALRCFQFMNQVMARPAHSHPGRGTAQQGPERCPELRSRAGAGRRSARRIPGGRSSWRSSSCSSAA